jgi:hypothetical protein
MTTTPLSNLTDTWNNSGTVFTAIKMNVANTAFDSASRMMDLQYNDTSAFWIDSDGACYIRQLTAAVSSYAFSVKDTGNSVRFQVGPSAAVFSFVAGGSITFSNFGNMISFGGGTQIWDEAAYYLALRNGTNPHSLRVYNTWTDVSNYERSVFDWGTTSNVLTIATQKAGTGIDRNIAINCSAGAGIAVSSGNIFFSDNSATIAAVRNAGGGTRGFQILSTGYFMFSPDGNAGSVPDTAIVRRTAQVLGVGDPSDLGGDGSTSLSGTFSYPATSPAQITSNQNNYNPGGKSYFQRWDSDASRDVTGLTFTAAQVDGQQHVIINVGAQNIVLKEQTTSTAANQFLNSTGADITLAPKQAAWIIYDNTTSRWRVFKYN